MHVCHVATIEAYPIKEEFGGGFRGVYYCRESKTRKRSDRLDSLAAARFWAQSEAHKIHAGQAGFSIAALRLKSGYRANVWVRA